MKAILFIQYAVQVVSSVLLMGGLGALMRALWALGTFLKIKARYS